MAILQDIGKVLNGLLATFNNSKYVTGLLLLITTIGTKYVAVELTPLQARILRSVITREVLVFSFLFITTRDFLISLTITLIFAFFSNHLLNEESNMCILPNYYKALKDVLDQNNDDVVSDEELRKARETLHKAKKQRELEQQKLAMLTFQRDLK